MSIDGYRIRRVDGNAARDHDLANCHDDMHVDGDSCPDCGGYRTGGTAADVTHQTPSDAEAKTATPSGTEAGAPGREVEPRSPAAPSRPDAINVIFDGPPAHKSGRFVEVETDDGRGVRVGEWIERPDGFWALRIAELPTPMVEPQRATADAHQRVTWTGPFHVEQDITDDDWTVLVGLTDDARRQLVRDLYKHRADLLTYFRMRMQAEDRHAGRSHRLVELEAENRLAGALQSMATTQWTLTPAQAEQLTDDLEDAQADPEPCAVGTCSAYSIDGSSYCAPHDEGI